MLPTTPDLTSTLDRIYKITSTVEN